MSNNNKNPNHRYIAKVKQSNHVNKSNGEAFTKFSVLVDNPNPNNQDGTPNKYYSGTLLWIDAETGKKYIVKGMDLAGVHQSAQERGFINSVRLDLGSQYHVQEVE